MEVLKVWKCSNTQRLEKQETSITLSATRSLGDGVTRTQKPGPSSGGGLPGGDWEMAEPQPSLKQRERNTLTSLLLLPSCLGSVPYWEASW